MSDDTQDPRTEPGDPNTTAARFVESVEPDTLPPVVVGLSHGDGCDVFTMLPHGSPYPPSGICLAGDGLSKCLSTPPNSGLDNVAWQRIVGICQLLHRNQTIIWRIEELLGLHAIGDNRDRIGAIAKSLSCRKQFIENAEHVINMGS